MCYTFSERLLTLYQGGFTICQEEKPSIIRKKHSLRKAASNLTISESLKMYRTVNEL